MSGLFSSLSDTQAHGSGDFDIRYWILRNPNWSLDEKKKLILNFWVYDEEYDETLEQLEWGIVTDHLNYKGNSSPLFEEMNCMNILMKHYQNFTEIKQ